MLLSHLGTSLKIPSQYKFGTSIHKNLPNSHFHFHIIMEMMTSQVWISSGKISPVFKCDLSARQCNPTQHMLDTTAVAVIQLGISGPSIPLFGLLM
jgi:hypothetical protein